MTDIATISAGLQSLKAAFEIGKAMLNLGLSVQVQDRIREMNERILAAQESAIASSEYQTALLKQIGDLEKQIADLEAWNAEAETYQLTAVARHGKMGVLVYAPKEGTHATEPSHALCANCFNNRHKAFLQNEERAGRCDVLACHRCGSDLYLTGYRQPIHVQTPAVVHKK